MLEARYAAGTSIRILAIGLVAIALNLLLYLSSSSPRIMLWVVGGVLVGLGMRILDRRVKLRIGLEGLLYAPWGKQPIYWSEFEGFDISRQGKIDVVMVRARNPDQFHSQLPLSARLDVWLNPRLGRPPLQINPTQLDVSAGEIIEALREYGG